MALDTQRLSEILEKANLDAPQLTMGLWSDKSTVH